MLRQNFPLPFVRCAICAFALSGSILTAQDIALQTTIQNMIAAPPVSRVHWGVHVTQLDGTPLVTINEGQFFQPASNNKLATTAAAMALLPIDQRLTTTVTGTAQNGVVHGDLTLHGAGDANLSGRAIPYVTPALRPPGPAAPTDELRYLNELADQLKTAGITHVDGDIVGDDTLMPWDPYPQDWSIDDALWYYGAPINALMIADNAINLKIAPGAKEGAQAVITLNPALPFYSIENQIVTVAKGAEAHTDIQRSVMVTGGSRVVRLYGTIALDAKPQSEDIAIEDPSEYAARALKVALEQRGITVTGAARAKHRVEPVFGFTREATEPLNLETTTAKMPALPANVLARHIGAPLYEDVVWTNKISQNQHAEMFLRLLGLTLGKDGSDAQGVRVVRSFLTAQAGIDPEDFVFLDGSGLSGHDLVTPRALTQLLRYAATQPWGARWKASLPVGGEDGGLRARFPNSPLKDHVFAKTGTLGEVHALSGYLECASGQTVVFSIISNAHTPRSSVDMQVMDKVIATIAAAE